MPRTRVCAGGSLVTSVSTIGTSVRRSRVTSSGGGRRPSMVWLPWLRNTSVLRSISRISS